MRVGDVLLWVLFILSLAMALWYFFGSSPTLEQSILIFMITALFGMVIKITKISANLDNLEKRFNRFEIDVMNSFKSLKEDINIIKEGLN
ncbi:hypothetical protein CMI38_01370 [Candidatus Pacearchaeota archaeon]|jgi:hypothetical protein|nr:hypothetical protein [Candidatus Pacearchaeota archaeon]|tara:strand:+ start:503 stop:772 length:270 start_codon:yes stop_codon:yes gene_type:complete